MLSLLETYMPEGVKWTHPEGGLFLWLTLPEGIDTVALYDKALAQGVAYVAGSFFYPDGSHRNTMRLNFSFIAREKMEPGIRLLSRLIADEPRIPLHKFSGAGNDFVVLDGRGKDVEAYREKERIGALCRAWHTDGLMILRDAPGYDFGMDFYNPDGSGGMMCGNGGRCIVAFAQSLGLKPASPEGIWHFLAPDGEHVAKILSSAPGKWTVRLKMRDCEGISPACGGQFLNTGTRHLVRFVPDVDAVDVEREGKALRWEQEFQPEGTNVNFVQKGQDCLHVRTFEKGVEGETLACGTGITASAIAAWKAGIPGQAGNDGAHRSYRLQCRRGDYLEVEFRPQKDGSLKEVYLTGPAEQIS